MLIHSCSQETEPVAITKTEAIELVEYIAPDTASLPDNLYGETVKYGAKLMANTPYYIGPDGITGNYLGNEMTCNNCHLNEGSKTFGNNLFNTHKTYPQYRARENKILTSADRVNNCITRPHSGKPMPLDSKEMIAFVTYIQWLGKDYDPSKHFGHGIKEIDYSNKSSNPERGKLVYEKNCQSCHMANGEGIYDSSARKYINPPLWGKWSYQEGSSMHRVIKSASFIHLNMPNPIVWNKPTLSVQEALDVAGFINSSSLHYRKSGSGVSYPNIDTKPIDYFKGPYNDTFSEQKHTFGPWDDIVKH